MRQLNEERWDRGPEWNEARTEVWTREIIPVYVGVEVVVYLGLDTIVIVSGAQWGWTQCPACKASISVFRAIK